MTLALTGLGVLVGAARRRRQPPPASCRVGRRHLGAGRPGGAPRMLDTPSPEATAHTAGAQSLTRRLPRHPAHSAVIEAGVVNAAGAALRYEASRTRSWQTRYRYSKWLRRRRLEPSGTGPGAALQATVIIVYPPHAKPCARAASSRARSGLPKVCRLSPMRLNQ
ncbi:MAG: hypothetical protein H6977_10105 [Gammaproteobacteria bacterium]|nr:hypothetical protein [Gammaproteobacteria bacterium]